METLMEKQVIDTLAMLHDKAEKQKSIDAKPLNNSERFMAISADQGRFLYMLCKIAKVKTIIEFGCSFGISTIYLAAAAKENGGSVITTEMEAAKWAPSLENISLARLEDFVTLFKGDALETLRKVKGPVDMLFLDGAKHLPVFELLSEHLRSGSIVFADNADRSEAFPFIDFVTRAHDRFLTCSVFEGRSLLIYLR